MNMSRPLATALMSIALLWCGPSFADPPSDGERAEALFEEGRRALDKEDYAAACALFEERQRLDPGAGTLMNLGTCKERLGSDAEALAHFRQALALLAPGDDRIEFAQARVAELEGKLVIDEAAQEPQPSAKAGAPAAPTLRQVGPRYEPEPPLLGWTLVGVGAAGMVTGVTTSILVAREQELVDRHCHDKLCDQTGFEAAERGQTLLWVNAIAYGVGLASLGTGLALVLSHDSSEGPHDAPRVRANIGLRSASIGYGGRF
jgi:tetratricopeptide (TPR) repeat protein